MFWMRETVSSLWKLQAALGYVILLWMKFFSLAMFLFHSGVHETSLRKFVCQDCGMAFAWKSTYVKHTVQFHSSTPPAILSCSEPGCGKEYKSLSQLQVITHEILKYRTFINWINLFLRKEHVKRDHKLIRRFNCEECNKQFYKAHDLLVHKRTHSKEKPYMCGTCGKSFSHISHVIRHEKSHNNIRPYTCPVCKKSFTQATVLRAHRYNSIMPIVTILKSIILFIYFKTEVKNALKTRKVKKGVSQVHNNERIVLFRENKFILMKNSVTILYHIHTLWPFFF